MYTGNLAKSQLLRPSMIFLREHGDENATALHQAAEKGAANAVRCLATHMGPDKVNLTTSTGFTAMHKVSPRCAFSATQQIAAGLCVWARGCGASAARVGRGPERDHTIWQHIPVLCRAEWSL